MAIKYLSVSFKMREAVCFVLIYAFANTVEAVNPKSVNLALETVLQFDKKDHSADVEVLNRVQSFLDNIKNVMSYSKSGRRKADARNNLKFTDFLLEAAQVLKNYDDNDLEDFFAVLDDQSRKYNYKGCKFYELVDNQDVRRFMSNKLEQAKDSSAKTMRRYLNNIIRVIRSKNYDEKDQVIVNLLNSLYDGVSDRFESVVQNLRTYNERTKDTDINLEDIVSTALRSLFFDHYSNLNDNARQQLKSEVSDYWQAFQGNGGNNKNSKADYFTQRQDYKSKLRVIDITKFNNNNNKYGMLVNKYENNNNNMYKWSESYFKNINQKVTPSNQQDVLERFKMSSYANRPSKMEIDFLEYKKSTRDYTRDQTIRTKDKATKKRYTKEFGYTKALNDEAITSSEFNRHPTKKKSPKFSDKALNKKKEKYISATKTFDEDETSGSYDALLKKKNTEITDTSSLQDSTDTAIGISIEVNNAKYINKQKKRRQGKKYANKNTKHRDNNDDHILRRKKPTKKSQRNPDDSSSDDDLITDENTDSSVEVKVPKETPQSMLGELDLLVGGQNIHGMHYRAENTLKKLPKKSHKITDKNKLTDKRILRNNEEDQNQKVKEILTDYNAVFNVQISTKKLRERPNKDRSLKNRPKSHHKSSNKTTEKNSNEKERKPSPAFAATVSDEGISIESFENDNVNRHSIVRKTNKQSTGNNNVSKLIHNLEKQLKDVKEQIEIVKAIGVNNTENDTNKTVNLADDQNDKAYEILVYSGTTKNKATETTTTKRDIIAVVKNDTEKEIKQDTTTTKMKVTSDITSKHIPKTMTSTPVASPVFRSHDDDNDNTTSQQSFEKESIKTTKLVKDDITTKSNFSDNTTIYNSNVDLKLNKTIENKTIASIKPEDKESETETLNNSTKLSDFNKNKTTSNKDVREKKEENTVKQTKSATFDLTKNIDESDTIILNIDDDAESNKTELKADMTKNIDNLGSPKLDLQDRRFDDPFNDLDVNLDFMT